MPQTFRAITSSYLWSISQCTTLWLLLEHKSAFLCLNPESPDPTAARELRRRWADCRRDVAQRGGQRCLFSLVNCLLELLHPGITPLDCAFTKYEVENALGSLLNHGVAESRPPVHCQWNTFRLNYIVILVLAALPLGSGSDCAASARSALTSPCTLQLIMSLFAKKLISSHRGNRLSS